MKITTLGIITACKNVGVTIASYTLAGIQANPEQFIFALVVYALISVPSDLYLLNKAHENGQKKE